MAHYALHRAEPAYHLDKTESERLLHFRVVLGVNFHPVIVDQRLSVTF